MRYVLRAVETTMPVSVVFEVNHKQNDVYFTNFALFSCCRIMFAVHFCVVL
jgi:hypothetical protein